VAFDAVLIVDPEVVGAVLGLHLAVLLMSATALDGYYVAEGVESAVAAASEVAVIPDEFGVVLIVSGVEFDVELGGGREFSLVATLPPSNLGLLVVA
jgi:hypothetical protein